MGRLKRAFASAVIALGIMVSMVVVAPVATAAPAHAYTTSHCYGQWYNGWRYDTICWYDYNWVEEVFQGKRDGWYRTGSTYA